MIALGADHGGYYLKEEVKKYFDCKNIKYKDCGTFNEDAIDYPLIAKSVVDEINAGNCEFGILFCGTGVGISIAANKYKGIRAASCSDYFSAKYSRLHNDANILCLGGRVIGAGTAIELVDVFINTEFEGGERHKNRISLISDIENENK